jgi:hypothetical protein
MFSKSIFGNNTRGEKSLINPVMNNELYFSSNELKFSVEEYLRINNFMDNLSFSNQSIDPIQYEEYINLENILSNIEIKTKNHNIQLLLKITSYGLRTMINAFGIHKENIEMNIKHMVLQNKMDLILTNKNEYNTINLSGEQEKQYTIRKQFTLSPIFSYYISFFGLPEEGLGFDQMKLQMIKTILETNYIHPYA